MVTLRNLRFNKRADRQPSLRALDNETRQVAVPLDDNVDMFPRARRVLVELDSIVFSKMNREFVGHLK